MAGAADTSGMRRLRSSPRLVPAALAAALSVAALGLLLPARAERSPRRGQEAPAPRLPPPRPRAVEPVAGQGGVVVAAPADVSATDVPPAPGGGPAVSPGAPSDPQVRRELEALKREQAKVQRVLVDASAPIRRGSGRFIWPVNGPVTSPFCERRSWEDCHPGLDIAAPTGTAIRAADSGQVVLAGPQGGYGNFTCIAHSGFLFTCYAHQSRILVRPGEVVRQGQVIGAVGCTGFCFGPHLHFEVRVEGRVTDPMPYL